MEKRIANYRVIIQKEHYPNGEVVYTADCPTLHVHDYGPTIEETLDSIKKGIEMTLDYLIEEGEEIPQDHEESFIVFTKFPLPKSAQIAIA